MFQTLRQTMTWLHTWVGLVLGFVLVVVFFFGSLSVFDREIDRWAIPSTRFEPQPMPRFDAILEPAFRRVTQPDPEDLEAAKSRVSGPIPNELPLLDWSAYTTHRDPVLDVYASFGLPNAIVPGDHIHGHMTIDPRTGGRLPDGERKLGSEFFYPMHYGLHLHWKDLGYWIVGLAAFAMLIALVSGVVIHRKIFREFFTFRPHKHTQRSALDLHNLTGVVALPFHFMFALSGLIIFAEIYFPVTTTMLRPAAEMHAAAEAERVGLPYEPAGVPATLASVDAMVEEAQRRWATRDMAGDVGFLFINHVGDRNAYVSVYRAGTDRVALTGEGIHFEGTTGRVIHEDPPFQAASATHNFVSGLHLQHFRHWLLRWLYFVGGIAGAVCIATGFVFFVEKRKRQHARHGIGGARFVDALAVTTVTGTLIATATMFVSNRLLPIDWAERAQWEEALFWGAWLAAFGHAMLRTRPVREARRAPAWYEQSWTLAALCIVAVVSNWITTGDHLVSTIARGYWPVAGIDLMLIAVAILAACTAHRLMRRAASADDIAPEFDATTGMAETTHG